MEKRIGYNMQSKGGRILLREIEVTIKTVPSKVTCKKRATAPHRGRGSVLILILIGIGEMLQKQFKRFNKR